MDLLEAGRRFRLAPELLRLDEENGLLRRCRCCLLEEIHQKQQALDQVDYLIRELRGK